MASWVRRLNQPEQTLAVYGDQARVVADLYRVGDPLVDAWVATTPHPMSAVADWQAHLPFAQGPPDDVDWARVDRGGAVLRSVGPLGSILLTAYCLPLAYLCPFGNKPLVATGDLRARAPQRLGETGLWWRTVMDPGAMRPGAVGHRLTMHVRVAHALVRQQLRPRMDLRVDGAPIPQPDLAATGLLFGAKLCDALASVGVPLSEADGDAVCELFWLAAVYLGLDPRLQTRTWKSGREMFALLTSWQHPPDADSTALIHALFDAPQARFGGPRGRVLSRMVRGVSHALLGSQRAASVGLSPDPGWLIPIQLLARSVGEPGGRRARFFEGWLNRMIAKSPPTRAESPVGRGLSAPDRAA